MSDKRVWTMENEVNPEAPIDPGLGSRGYTEQDYEGHRAHSMYFGMHVPNRRSHRRHKGALKQSSGKGNAETEERQTTPPAQRVQFILGEEAEPDGGTAVETHPLFSEMEELVKDGEEIEWKETARWVKFEEDVEEGGNRWSKPHVATLSLHSLFELRSYILNGSIMLDMEATNLEQVADLVCENMVNNGALSSDIREKVRDALLRRHRHQHEQARKNHMGKLPLIRSLADIGKNHSATKSFFRTTPATSVSCNALANNQSDSFLSPNFKQPSFTPKDQRGVYLQVPSGDDSPTNSHSIAMAIMAFHTPNAGISFGPALPLYGDPNQSQTSVHQPLADVIKGETITTSPSTISMQRNSSSGDLDEKHKTNINFMRKIPPGAEASNILVGEVDFLDKTLAAFVRLNQAYILGDLTEVPVPTRFIFVLLGPPGSQNGFREVGRVMATLMSDEVFHEVAYRAKKRDHLIAGIDEFLDAVTVLPPGEWDPSIRIEPPASVPSQEERKKPDKKDKNKKEEINEEELEQKLRDEAGLSRTGRLWGGLINDIKRKKPWYWSDFKDALSLQCVASWIFLYFACLSPIITFGGLLGQATGNNIAAMESLLSGFVCGVGYGFFSGQPLTILGSTGPVLVFETIVYDFCQKANWDYISFRLWIGIWIAAILVLLVAIDASAFVCYITRFTEENFACLIAFIFIYKAIENVLKIGQSHPLNMGGLYDCSCIPPGEGAKSVHKIHEVSALGKDYCLSINGTLLGADCEKPAFVSDVFLMSIILFTGTYIISVLLKDFKNALFFPSGVRQIVSDFAVIIAIFAMTIFDYLTKVPTPKLMVPKELKPTLPDRGWIIAPFHHKNPIWVCIIAVLPALLGTILIFMDQQITAVIINRKENKLKKGCGYHLDLFVLAGLILICSIMGLPWFVAATVLSINHVNSLKVESESAAPGEKPQFLGVREQRVTHIMIFVTIGSSVMLTPLLSHIPMPVLYGVFLYMGAASLKGLQFFDRLLIMLMPVKYQPDFMFLRQVPIKRVHLFTIIQLACLVTLWSIKSFTATSILFPLMLVIMIGIRKSLDFVFTRRELKILDDIMPDFVRREKSEDMHDLDAEDGRKDTETKLNTSSSNGNLTSSINITEEVNKTTIWKQVNDGKLFFTRKFRENKEKANSEKNDKKDKGLDMIKEVADIDHEKKKLTSVSQV